MVHPSTMQVRSFVIVSLLLLYPFKNILDCSRLIIYLIFYPFLRLVILQERLNAKIQIVVSGWISIDDREIHGVILIVLLIHNIKYNCFEKTVRQEKMQKGTYRKWQNVGLTVHNMDQQHFLNLFQDVGWVSGSILRSSDIFIPTVCSDIYPVSRSFSIFYVRVLKATSTLLYSFALISIKFNPSFQAKARPYPVEICLSDYRSILLPTKSTCMAAFPLALTSSSHS